MRGFGCQVLSMKAAAVDLIGLPFRALQGSMWFRV